jgi:hypothetical protein
LILTFSWRLVEMSSEGQLCPAQAADRGLWNHGLE